MISAMGVRTEILVWTDFNQDVVEKLRSSDNDDEKATGEIHASILSENSGNMFDKKRFCVSQ